jgi:hypothetical protein
MALMWSDELMQAVKDSPGRVQGERVLLFEPMVSVQPGVICGQALHHYAHGQCAIFALALAERLKGSQIALLHPMGGIDDWVHALVYHRGLLLDIRGIVAPGLLVSHWNELCTRGPYRISLPAPRDMRRLLGHLDMADPLDLAVARQYAEVIERASQKRCGIC